MVIYSVRISVSPECHDEWLSWMRSVHIPDVMATGHFLDFSVARLLEPMRQDDWERYRIDYRCESTENLKSYQQRDAVRLQAEHSNRFHGQYEACREVLEMVVQR